MKRERGHAMLELAMSAGVMVSCLVGTFQFGYTFYTYNQLVTAVGDGARYAAQRTYRAATDQDVERGNAAIRNMVVYRRSASGARLDSGAAEADARAGGRALGVRGRWRSFERERAIKGYTMDAIYRSYHFQRAALRAVSLCRQIRSHGE